MNTRLTITLAWVVGSPIALFSACLVNDRADAAHPLPMFDAAPPEPMPSDTPDMSGAHRHVDESVKDTAVIADRTDAEIASDIKSAIAKNSSLADEAKVTVAVDHGNVTLKGTVRDVDMRDSVENIVRHTAGVAKLDDRIIAIDPHQRAVDPGPTGY